MSNTLSNDDWLLVGQSLWSDNGRNEFKMQEDGKIALYHDGECVWQNTPEQRDDIKGIKMQEDGNLCMYTNEAIGHCTWHSNTAAPSGDDSTYLIVQDDGNVVLYNADDEPIWDSNSQKAAPPQKTSRGYFSGNWLRD